MRKRKRVYAAYGVDTDAAIKKLQDESRLTELMVLQEGLRCYPLVIYGPNTVNPVVLKPTRNGSKK